MQNYMKIPLESVDGGGGQFSKSIQVNCFSRCVSIEITSITKLKKLFAENISTDTNSDRCFIFHRTPNATGCLLLNQPSSVPFFFFNLNFKNMRKKCHPYYRRTNQEWSSQFECSTMFPIIKCEVLFFNSVSFILLNFRLDLRFEKCMHIKITQTMNGERGHCHE